MNLRKKLLLNATIPLLLAVVMIGFIISQMMQLQSSSENDVKNLVSVEKLNADMLSVQQSLGTFSYLSSDANAQVVKDGFDVTKKEISQLKNRLSIKSQSNLLEKLNVKFSQLEEKSLLALTNLDQTEAKRQSLRTKGPLNDLYNLNKMVNESYQVKQDDIQKQISFVITAALIGSIVLLLVTIIISFISTTRITVPIKKLADNANRIAKGDLTVKMESVRSKDEVGQLNEAFILMAEHLKSIVKHIAVTSEQVASSSQKLSASAVQTITTSQEMSKSMQEMALGADHQMKMSVESAQAVEETTIGVTRIAESSTELSELTSETVLKAEEGYEFVGKTVDQMNTIRDSVNVTDERIQLLNNRSKEIDDIVSIISAIAGQTNLLALNAAIEAARAGEYGKGFAVVADEVRKLAEETNLSAQKIGSIIKDVQKETGLSVTSMNDVRNNVESGIQITIETREKFTEIVKAMDRMTSQIEEISATSEEISAGSQEVAASVQDMAGVAKHSSESTRKAAQSAEGQLASMEEINLAVSQLSNMATELENIINTFQMEEKSVLNERRKK